MSRRFVANMSGGIYISYRRDDTSFLAGRLYDRLLEHFPQNIIFMDLDRVAPGEDLIETIEKAIEFSGILIAVIGKQWLISDFENLDDHVHLELAAAFKRNIRVIPILAEGASMPCSDELPDDLKSLALLNASQISEADFDADYRRLVTAIEEELLMVLLRAAEAGNIDGMISLGSLYQNGQGVAKDYGQAREWFQKAAEAGDIDGMISLGMLYKNGQGVAKDYGQAREWFQKAAEAGNIDGMIRLGMFGRMFAALPALDNENMDARQAAVQKLAKLATELFDKTCPEVDDLASILASGNVPKEAVHRAVNVPGEPERNPVDCTVFAPDRVEPKQTGLLQAFLHAPEARRQTEAAAKQFDPKATERGHRSLVLDAPFGTTFAFLVEIEGFVFPERTDTLLWTGQPQAATFRFDVPEDCKLGQHVGTVVISQDGAPVGRITFQIEAVLEARGFSQQPVGKEARHYHACFCSYSSLDRAEMLKRAQGIRATGLETFIDVLTLRPGDIWHPKIFAAIDESDLFVVIWSTNARDSEWVKKESQYALRHYMEHGSPDFVPIPVEGPPIASVPQDLQAHHFNDELLGQIRAAELEMLARKHLGQSNVTPVTSRFAQPGWGYRYGSKA